MDEELLLPDEVSLATYEGLRVDDQSGFSGMVTDRRLIFWQPGLLHDVRLDAVAALSWGRLRPPLWVAIIGSILALFGLSMLRQGFGVLLLLVGGGMVALWLLYRREKLVVYTTGSKAFSINGPNAALASLLRTIRSR